MGGLMNDRIPHQWIVLETPPTDDPAAAAGRNLAFLRERFAW